jgi:hypothetical protein
VTLTHAAPIQLKVHEEASGRTLRFASDTAQIDHQVRLTLLPAHASLVWEVHPLTIDDPKAPPLWEGALEVPAPPSAANLLLQRETSSEALTPWVLGNMGCEGGVVTILDPDGRVVWYEAVVDTFPGGVVSTRWTEEGTVLALVGHDRLVEIDLHGETRFEARLGTDFNHPIHHDAIRWQGWTFALHAHTWTGKDATYVVDGLTVFDREGALYDERSLTEWVEPVGLPSALSLYWITRWGSMPDWFHANGLGMDEDGELLLTLRHQSTLAAFVGDPESSDFGQPLWHVVGDPDVQMPEGLWLTGEPGADIPVGFDGPHSPRPTETGVLLLDNQAAGRRAPRGLAMRIEPSAGSATIEQAWSVPETCTYQGGAEPLTGGHVLITCGKKWFEVNDQGDIVDEVEPTCEDGLTRYPARVEPIPVPSFVD